MSNCSSAHTKYRIITYIQDLSCTKNTYRPDSSEQVLTNLIANFKNKTKQIIIDLDALSHLSSLHNKILQELNLNGLCKYSNSHQAYIFKNSNHILNCSYNSYLMRSTCYVFTPNTHQCYKINANEILVTPECQTSSYMLLSRLTNTPIVQLPGQNKPYLLFIDASNFCYSDVLTQASTAYSNEALLKILNGEAHQKC